MIRILQFSLFLMLMNLISTNSVGQCTTAPYGSWGSLTPTCDGTFQNATTCGYRGEYSNISVVAGNSYTFQSSITSDYITIATTANTPLVWGTGTVNWVATFTGTVRFFTHTNSSCGSASGCMTRRVMCTGSTPPPPTGCINTSSWGSGNAPTTNAPLVINTCTFQSEYNTLFSVVAGETYQSSYSLGGYITIRSGSFNGTLVAQGNSPLTWTAPTSGTYYIHYNTNSSCGVASNCGTTTIVCTTCSAPITNFSVDCSGASSFDSGGNSGNYSNSEDNTYTYCPSNSSSKVSLVFTSFSLENNWDFLYVYNGSSVASTLIGTYTGTTLPPTITSTDPSGCLTLRFTSDGSVTSAGWAANLAYSPLVSGSHNTTLLQGCNGINPANLSLTTPPSGGSTPYTYQWLKNGSPISGANLSSYNEPAINTPGVYQFNVSITDACGQSVVTSPKEVNVVPDPTEPSAQQVGSACVGELVTLDNPVYGTEAGRSCPIEYSSSLDGSTWTTNSTSIPNFTADYSLADTNYIRMRVSGGCSSGCNASSWTVYRFYPDPLVCLILPIELNTFNGELIEGNGYLNWVTESETNSSHFELEKSKDGLNFEKIATLASENLDLYSYTDKFLFNGQNYYRLKMVDLDNSYTYSNIIVLEKETSNGDIYPNPFNSFVTIDGLDETDFTIEVLDMLGKKVYEQKYTNYDNNKVEFDLSNLIDGNYIIVVKDINSKTLNKKILRKI